MGSKLSQPKEIWAQIIFLMIFQLFSIGKGHCYIYFSFMFLYWLIDELVGWLMNWYDLMWHEQKTDNTYDLQPTSGIPKYNIFLISFV